MNRGFWAKLPKPFFCLAPLADVTDAAFRRLIAKYGKPDVLWTEFVSADGLAHPVGRKKLLPSLQFSAAERPIVAQLFGARPEKMFAAARLVAELGFDGLDLNFGCPDRAVEQQGAGAALIKNPKLARELIQAACEGSASRRMPISVKTRLGYNLDELENWLPVLLEEKLAAITIHARTRKEMSKVPARWERVKRAVEIRDSLKSQTLIIGNGDVMNLAEARERAAQSGADGVMLGRAIFGNPWLFANLARAKSHKVVGREFPSSAVSRPRLCDSSPRDQRPCGPPFRERLRTLGEHLQLFDELLGGVKSFAVMKKHFKAYLPEKSLRLKLMATNSAAEAEQIITAALKNG